MTQTLQEHLAQEHKLSQSSQYIGEVVYGGIDGIVTTFAVVSWFVGAGATDTLGEMGVLAVVLFGLANLFGDGVSMALGAYLSTKSEQDIYKRAWNKEAHEIVHNTDMEIEESVEILIEQGMKQEDATATVAIMQQYPTLWTKWMMDNELGMSDVRDDNAFMQGVITLVSFLIFGTIPLLPYLVLTTEADMWMTSLTMTAVALFLLGITRWYVTRIDFVKTVSQMVLLGWVAAAVAYATGYIVMLLQ